MTSVYFIGVGNPARGDDGLGPALAERVEDLCLPGVTVESDYQLEPEHAVPMGSHDVVIIADAAVCGPAPFGISLIEARPDTSFSTHGLDPHALLALAQLNHKRPIEAYLLTVRGTEFEPFSEKLSDEARRNLDEALAFLVPLLCAEPRRVGVLRRAARPARAACLVPSEDGR
jgi:hydrogenase maturation protease